MTGTVGSSLPRVVIAGRPNVGKSTLFNRIVGERRAIVEDEPGTTRDVIEAEVEWGDRRFVLADTGGYEQGDLDRFGPLVARQVEAALAGADLVLLCVDSEAGVTPADEEVADLVRKTGKPVIVVATKADSERREAVALAEASALGLGTPVPVSALHDINVVRLLDLVAERLPETPPSIERDRVRLAVVGRPNVGKSMLVNAVLGEPRVIVSEVPGTTRDAIDTDIDTPFGPFTLIDTAGVRRRGKIERGVEYHSVLRTRAAIERSDVAVLVIDGSEGVTAQDTHVAGMVLEATKGLVVAVNKTDLWGEGFEARRRELSAQLRRKMGFAPWALVAFVSALTGRGIDDLLRLAAEARAARRRRVPTGELNTLLRAAFRKHAPPVVRHKRLKLFYATQAGVDPPTFVLFVNDPELVHFSYRRYLERTIRTAYDFEGTAIRIIFRPRNVQES
ncbi:GTPase Der [bacterium HR29]|jgi:GTP-binding protein|nr:GTPase Der [bacterium HR29]